MQSHRHSPYRPHDAFDLAALLRDLEGLDIRLDSAERDRAGADYHWSSPVLLDRLLGKRPDAVLRPRDSADVGLIAAACARHRVPLTVRGGGTGNYGQCVPLFGGVSLDMTGLNRVLRVEDGWASVQAGVLLHSLNLAARQTGQQLRMWPSTERIATLGGFIAEIGRASCRERV